LFPLSDHCRGAKIALSLLDELKLHGWDVSTTGGTSPTRRGWRGGMATRGNFRSTP